MTYMRLMRRSLVVVAILGTLTLSAQQAQPPAVEFDVASIKPNKTGSNSSGTHQTNGLWRGENNTIKSLIAQAYEVLPEQIAGAPSWIDSERFNIEARYEPDPATVSPEQPRTSSITSAT